MTSSVHAAFTPARRVQAMLDVETALADALAEAGVIPVSSVGPIRAAARADRYDLAALTAEAADAGNLLIPLVRHLTREVSALDPVAAGHVHRGATSQDVIDTALVLQLRDAVGEVLAALDATADAAADLAARHVATPIAGRTWLQQATPTTFGAKAAAWLDGVARARQRLGLALDDALTLQFGGATGTLSTLGAAGPAVAEGLARRLDLRAPDLPWHTERSRLVDVACALGLACGTLGKVAGDVILLAQTEVGEAHEAPAPGRGGSSAMPHKQNPVASVVAAAAAVQAPGLVATMLAAMPQEHERAAGAWQAEWDTLPALVTVTARSAHAMAGALATLVIDDARMRANLDLAGGIARAEGLVAALAPALGRPQAITVVEAACRLTQLSGRALADVAADSVEVRAHLDPAAITRALDPQAFAGSSRLFVDRVLARWPRRKG